VPRLARYLVRRSPHAVTRGDARAAAQHLKRRCGSDIAGVACAYAAGMPLCHQRNSGGVSHGRWQYHNRRAITRHLVATRITPSTWRVMRKAHIIWVATNAQHTRGISSVSVGATLRIIAINRTLLAVGISGTRIYAPSTATRTLANVRAATGDLYTGAHRISLLRTHLLRRLSRTARIT